MQKTNLENNRFEKLWRRYKRRYKKVLLLIKIISIILISLILLEFISFIFIGFYTTVIEQKINFNSEVYQDKEWVKDYIKEFKESFEAEYYPHVGHRRVPNYEGKYINLDDNSIRKTFFQCSDGSEEFIKIFVFGGSTMWGAGVRDVATIPSLLSKNLCDKGFAVEVTNFGESGYTNTQEMIKLQLELRKGNIPDIIIFYDGVNNVYSSYQNQIAGVPQNIENRKEEFNAKLNLNKFNPKIAFSNFNRVLYKLNKMLHKTNFFMLDHNETIDEDTADIYFNNIKIIKALGKEFNFKSYFYWQPTLFTKTHHSVDESNLRKLAKDTTLAKSYVGVTKKIQLSEEVNDLTDIFNNQTNTIFTDWNHVSEEGNSMVAREITEDIVNYLKEKDTK